MAIIGTFTKQPVEVLDYDIRTDEWLSDADVVASAASTVSPAGLTIQSTSVVESGTVVKVWLAGGTSGVKYKVETTMTTGDGRVKQVEFVVKVKEV